MPTTIRKSIFETNSSSSHALVVSRSDEESLSENKVKLIFKVYSYEFGRNYGIYTDASHKFSYVFHFLLNMVNMPSVEILPRNTPKTVVRKTRKEMKERFEKFKILLNMIADQICKRTKIQLDFSLMKIDDEGQMICENPVPENDYWCLTGDNGVCLDSQLNEFFEMEGCANAMNRLLDSNQPLNIVQENPMKEGPKMQLTTDGFAMTRCLSRMLDFAFDENSILMTSDDSTACEGERAKLICQYVEKNQGNCLISFLY